VKVRDPVEVTCKEVVELVRDYLAHDLSPEDTVRFEQHLHACTWCMTYLEQLRTTVRLTGQLKSEAIAPEAKALLSEAFRKWKKS
jgi:predicted anti-sigma-YlaC factor YlaD